MGQTGCPEMSVRKYHSTLRETPEERISHVPVTIDASECLSVRPSLWQNVIHREAIKHFNGVQYSVAERHRHSPVSIEIGQEKHIMRISSLNVFLRAPVNLQIYTGQKRASSYVISSANILSCTHFTQVLWFSK